MTLNELTYEEQTGWVLALDRLVDHIIMMGGLIEECRCGHHQDQHEIQNEEWTPGCEACREALRGHAANHPYEPVYRRRTEVDR